eukprot:COSAG06_NODE_4373_length_4321_cov_9.736855_3_plen_93_part_00
MAAAYHPAGRKRWLAARGGHARGETARAGAAEQHDGQAPATAAAATAAATQLNFTADLSQPGGAIYTLWYGMIRYTMILYRFDYVTCRGVSC